MPAFRERGGMSTATIVIVLELGEPLDHPRGTAGLPDGEPRPFHGWLGLTAAIESLTEAVQAAPATQTGGTPC
jgi:hypothetical protein